MEAGHHILTHDEPGEQPQVNAIVIQIMHDFKVLLKHSEKIDIFHGSTLRKIAKTTILNYGKSQISALLNEYFC